VVRVKIRVGIRTKVTVGIRVRSIRFIVGCNNKFLVSTVDRRSMLWY
jgi:hypothetical protein